MRVKGFEENPLPKIKKSHRTDNYPMEVAEAHSRTQAVEAINSKKHVVLRCDLTIEEESEIKRLAGEREVLLLGPRCSFSIVGDLRFGSWNALPPGPVGLVGTTTSGLRGLSVLLAPVGIRHVLYVGACDLSQRIAGSSTIQALRFLNEDPKVEVIGVVGLTPATTVERKIMEAVNTLDKPCFFCMPDHLPSRRISQTLLETAGKMASALNHQLPNETAAKKIVERESAELAYGQRHIRGLYTGRFLCAEAQVVLEKRGKTPYSNVPLKPRNRLADPHSSRGHALVDMSAAEFTGEQELLMDPAPLASRMIKESSDLGLAVIVFDLELGRGGHPNPATIIGEAIRKAKQTVEDTGGYLSVIGTVLGTDGDTPSRTSQEKKLAECGAVIVPSPTRAIELALQIVGTA